jgi:hypothetical protein
MSNGNRIAEMLSKVPLLISFFGALCSFTYLLQITVAGCFKNVCHATWDVYSSATNVKTTTTTTTSRNQEKVMRSECNNQRIEATPSTSQVAAFRFVTDQKRDSSSKNSSKQRAYSDACIKAGNAFVSRAKNGTSCFASDKIGIVTDSTREGVSGAYSFDATQLHQWLTVQDVQRTREPVTNPYHKRKLPGQGSSSSKQTKNGCDVATISQQENTPGEKMSDNTELLLQHLEAMGFNKIQAINALEVTSGNLEEAGNHLFLLTNQEAINGTNLMATSTNTSLLDNLHDNEKTTGSTKDRSADILRAGQKRKLQSVPHGTRIGSHEGHHSDEEVPHEWSSKIKKNKY